MHNEITPPGRAHFTVSERYPDPAVKNLDPRFAKVRLTLASVERLYTGCRWSEGPVYFGDARCLIWSDIPNNRMLRWDEDTGAVSVYRKPSNNANGNTRDRQGRLLTCEHDARRVTRTEYDGSITVICDNFEGKKLNSPNDIVVKSDGSIWFTDPDFGIMHFYEGHNDKSEIHTNVYRVDPQTGKVSIVIDEITRPNGLAFSPDEKKLYVVDCGATPRTSGLMKFLRTELGFQTEKFSSMQARADRRTVFVSMSMAICGAAGVPALPNSMA